MANNEFPEDLEPVIDIEINDGEVIEARRDNAHLVQYMAAHAIFDHILVVDNEDEEVTRSYWIFALIHPGMYDPLSETMIENNYPQHYFVPSVSDQAKEAYDLQVGVEVSDLGIGIPSDWLE